MTKNQRIFAIVFALLLLSPSIALLGLKSLPWLVSKSRTARASFLYASGKTPHCSFAQMVRGLWFESRQDRAIERIMRNSQLVTAEPSMEMWNTEQGRFWIAPNQDKRITALLFAEQALNLYGEVKPGSVVLDCGSHWGLFTRHALDRGAKLVVAIDPAPDTMACFKRTFAAEIRAGRVIPYEKGVWDKDDWLTMNTDQGRTWQNSFVLTWERKPALRLPVTTVDKIVTELNLPSVDLIKMDVEGAERKAIAGATQTISRWHPQLSICVYHLQDDPVAIPAAVSKIAPYRMECQLCREYIGFRPHVASFVSVRAID